MLEYFRSPCNSCNTKAQPDASARTPFVACADPRGDDCRKISPMQWRLLFPASRATPSIISCVLARSNAPPVKHTRRCSPRLALWSEACVVAAHCTCFGATNRLLTVEVATACRRGAGGRTSTEINSHWAPFARGAGRLGVPRNVLAPHCLIVVRLGCIASCSHVCGAEPPSP